VVDALKKSGKPQYLDDVLQGPAETEGGTYGESPEDTEQDALYDQAVRIVTETRRASISGIQRRLKIGYNRAARMIEAMEAAGIVSPAEGNGTREVLVPPPPED
jgi:S-DNA-T family DNA segregation ATPase FtsK/SpoIIIE